LRAWLKGSSLGQAMSDAGDADRLRDARGRAVKAKDLLLKRVDCSIAPTR
jgi:hypothetical protein